jgi:hypothetical protein
MLQARFEIVIAHAFRFVAMRREGGCALRLQGRSNGEQCRIAPRH